jgi:hypothetical protein
MQFLYDIINEYESFEAKLQENTTLPEAMKTQMLKIFKRTLLKEAQTKKVEFINENNAKNPQEKVLLEHVS